MSLNLKDLSEARRADTVKYTVTTGALKKSPSPPAAGVFPAGLACFRSKNFADFNYVKLFIAE
jgi:hypothetical protein